jgi:very-short-patch-repair endonuclease
MHNRKFRNLKFRRQQIVEGFIVDFYCDELKLCIEIDGGVHNEETIKEYDIERERALKIHNLTIMRFSNDEVKKDITEVLKKIGEIITLWKYLISRHALHEWSQRQNYNNSANTSE